MKLACKQWDIFFHSWQVEIVNAMKNLPLPNNRNCICELKVALTYKDGTAKHQLSNQEVRTIKSIYSRYETLLGKPYDDLKALTTLSLNTKDAIHDAYGEVQENNRLSKLRARLMLATDRCPFCGIGTVATLDHHLPRSIFKPLSVYSSNLVPLCEKCNNKKRISVGDNPSNSFIHVYYDVLPNNERFLIANTRIKHNKLRIEFTVIKTPSMSEDIFTMLTFQFNKIDFNKRVLKEINIFLCSFITGLDNAYSASKPETVKQFLLDNEKNFNINVGINDWRSSLLSSLALNNSFCDGGFKVVLGPHRMC